MAILMEGRVGMGFVLEECWNWLNLQKAWVNRKEFFNLLYKFLKLFKMLLPNAEFAYIPDEKLYDYALSEIHPVGKHKAMVFKKLLGITIEDAEVLRRAILEAILVQEAIYNKTTHFGELYAVDFLLEKNERNAMIRTAWIVLKEENIPRLTSCYIL